MVKDYYVKNDITGACEHLFNESKKRWMKVNKKLHSKKR
jgi:hypothetical protein